MISKPVGGTSDLPEKVLSPRSVNSKCKLCDDKLSRIRRKKGTMRPLMASSALRRLAAIAFSSTSAANLSISSESSSMRSRRRLAQQPGIPMPPPRMLYGRNEAAYLLCLSTRSLDYLIGKKELAVRRVGRKILVPHNELLKFARKDHDAVASDNTEDYGLSP